MADAPGRPRAWGVLAVALALMALVVALSSAHGTPTPSGTGERAVAAPASTTAPASTRQVPSASTGSPHRAHVGARPRAATRGGAAAHLTAPVTGAGTSAPSTAGTTAPMASVPDQLTSGTSGTATGQLSASAATPSHAVAATTTTTASSGGTSAPTARSDTGASTPGPYPGSGDIVWPATSVAYPSAGGGLVTAAATWTGTPTMTLSISCPDGVSQSRSGATGLSLEADDTGGAGTCEVTLAAATVTSGAVSYTLTIEPGP